jgi:hypothetical protein
MKTNQTATAERKLEKGDLVTVYDKPITDGNVEGVAKLIRHIPNMDDPEVGEYWMVRFTNETKTYPRFVNVRNLLKA